MQSGSLSDFLRMAGIFGPDRKRKGFIVPYKVKLRASSSLHHWGRGTASAVEGVRLSLLTEQKLLIGKVGLMGKRAYPDGEAEYLAERRTGTKTGSVFVPHFHPAGGRDGSAVVVSLLRRGRRTFFGPDTSRADFGDRKRGYKSFRGRPLGQPRNAPSER